AVEDQMLPRLPPVQLERATGDGGVAVEAGCVQLRGRHRTEHVLGQDAELRCPDGEGRIHPGELDHEGVRVWCGDRLYPRLGGGPAGVLERLVPRVEREAEAPGHIIRSDGLAIGPLGILAQREGVSGAITGDLGRCAGQYGNGVAVAPGGHQRIEELSSEELAVAIHSDERVERGDVERLAFDQLAALDWAPAVWFGPSTVGAGFQQRPAPSQES